MRRPAPFLPIVFAPPSPVSPHKMKLRIAENVSESWLFRLSFALSIIGVFWMAVKLHEYVIWDRGGEKALLLVAVIASCVIILFDERIRVELVNRKPNINRIFWILALSLLTSVATYLIYLTTSEPSPISLQYPEIPPARSLKLEGIAIVVIILVPFCAGLARCTTPKISRYLPICIIAFFAVSALGHVASFLYSTCGADFPQLPLRCRGLGLADIGGTTLNAVHAVFRWINPYTIDVQGSYTGSFGYRGYRYWPVMFAIYMPVTFFFDTGWGAMRLTNFALDMTTAALIILLAGRRSGWLSGVLAASLYLMLPMLSDRIYQWTDTDLAAIVFLLAALALYQTRPGIAGVMVGLSVSAKFIPGLLMLMCCLPEFRRGRYVGGFVLGLAPAITFCLLAPSQFISNTVLCLFATPTDNSSWLYGAPGSLASAARLAVILLFAAVSWLITFRPPGFFERCVIYVICVVAMLLVSHVHNNYMLWWLPFFCIALSSPLSAILSLPRSPSNAAANTEERHVA